MLLKKRAKPKGKKIARKDISAWRGPDTTNNERRFL
jgi:hypothetical protein